MDKAEKIDEICQALGVTTRRGQRMSNHTVLGVGGEIDCIAYPETREAAAQLIARLDEAAISWSALGAGCNLLVYDEPIHRVAISLKLLEELLIFDGAKARVHGGYRVSRLVAAAAERGLSGLEGLAALPGTVGGAIRGNESARGYEITPAIESLSVAKDGEVVNLSRDQITPGGRELILGCVIELQEADAGAVKRRVARYLRLGKASAPGVRSVGPVFRDVRGRSPARIISRLGLKGSSCGDAAIAEWDSNFLVNKGAATARDLLGLIELVRKQVRDRSGIELELALEVWR